jgi:hypothetical protein
MKRTYERQIKSSQPTIEAYNGHNQYPFISLGAFDSHRDSEVKMFIVFAIKTSVAVRASTRKMPTRGPAFKGPASGFTVGSYLVFRPNGLTSRLRSFMSSDAQYGTCWNAAGTKPSKFAACASEMDKLYASAKSKRGRQLERRPSTGTSAFRTGYIDFILE